MKPQKKMIALLLFILSGITILWWHCETKKVGPTEPANENIADLISALNEASTASEIETTYSKILSKCGIGLERPIIGSKYEYYVLSTRQCKTLSEIQMRFKKQSFQMTLSEEVNQILKIRHAVFLSASTLESVITKLNDRLKVALTSPEYVDNSILIFLASENGKMPTASFSFNANTQISPLQWMVLCIWVHREFVDTSKILRKDIGFAYWACVATAYLRYDVAYLAAFVEYIVAREDFPDWDRFNEAVAEAGKNLDDDLQACHNQGDCS